MRKHFEYGNKPAHVNDSECVPCYAPDRSCGETRVVSGKKMCGAVNERKYELLQWGYYHECPYQIQQQLTISE